MFYGDIWGYDWYWDWTGFADALTWDYDWYWDSSDYQSLTQSVQMSDYEFEVHSQMSNAGLLSLASDLRWEGRGYTGTFPPWVIDSLNNDPDFADGILYGFHTDVGNRPWDYRSYSGTFGSGSLQVVISTSGSTIGNFHADVDRFNPYQDVVSFFGHTFAEVVPNLFRRLF